MGETSPNNAGDEGSIPGQGAKTPHALWPKNQNRNSIVTNSIKTFKMVKKIKICCGAEEFVSLCVPAPWHHHSLAVLLEHMS